MRKTVIWIVLAVMSFTAVADAHTAYFPARIKRIGITIEGNLVTKLTGKIRSQKRQCLSNRTLVVYHGDMRFGSTTTAADGSWVIDDQGFVDRHYKYTLYPKRIGRLPHRHMCSIARFTEYIGPGDDTSDPDDPPDDGGEFEG